MLIGHLPILEIELKVLYTTVHTEPVETVTVIPELTETVPALNPLFPAAIV